MGDKDDRFERIKRKPEGRLAAGGDIRWLIYEVERLRKVEAENSGLRAGVDSIRAANSETVAWLTRKITRLEGELDRQIAMWNEVRLEANDYIAQIGNLKEKIVYEQDEIARLAERLKDARFVIDECRHRMSFDAEAIGRKSTREIFLAEKWLTEKP
jgi:uncharacterized coiled-coil DUF342 family protein